MSHRKIGKNMITVKKILEDFPNARGDGYGNFLNLVSRIVYGGEVDFHVFKVETWTRARRKVMELFPHLDDRKSAASEADDVSDEMTSPTFKF